MLTDFQKRKLTRVFRLFDNDNSAFVDHSDVGRIVGNVATAVGARVGSREYATIQARYGDLWKVVVGMDSDGDGRVTLTEWLVAMDKMISSEDRYDEVMGQTVDQIFDLFDANDDGEITRQEYAQWLQAYGVGADRAGEAFLKIDLNGDGIISKDEMTHIFLDFFYSDDTKSPGNWLFGEPV